MASTKWLPLLILAFTTDSVQAQPPWRRPNPLGSPLLDYGPSRRFGPSPIGVGVIIGGYPSTGWPDPLPGVPGLPGYGRQPGVGGMIGGYPSIGWPDPLSGVPGFPGYGQPPGFGPGLPGLGGMIGGHLGPGPLPRPGLPRVGGSNALPEFRAPRIRVPGIDDFRGMARRPWREGEYRPQTLVPATPQFQLEPADGGTKANEPQRELESHTADPSAQLPRFESKELGRWLSGGDPAYTFPDRSARREGKPADWPEWAGWPVLGVLFVVGVVLGLCREPGRQV
jgi:hypothetical protein